MTEPMAPDDPALPAALIGQARAERADESKLTKPPGIPEGMFLALPVPKPGEHVPPIPVEFSVGLTDPDKAGHRWAVLRCGDGTVTVDFRLPWQMAGQIGMQIAQGLAAMMQKAAAEEHGGLVVPGQPAGGGLVVARAGTVPPPVNGGQRVR